MSGAEEDLNFQGTELNQINTIFYGGYLLGQIPNNLILQKVPPRIWLPTTCLCWGFLTLGTGFTHHPWQIMVIRFVSAQFESQAHTLLTHRSVPRLLRGLLLCRSPMDSGVMV